MFKRMFDYLTFERYEEHDELRNNTEFLRLWGNVFRQTYKNKNWVSKLISAAISKIKDDPKFFKKKNMMRNSAAVGGALYMEDKDIAKEVEYKLTKAIVANMFKYRDFTEVKKNLVQNILEPILIEAKKTYNISDKSVADCKKKECDGIREPFELLLLAPNLHIHGSNKDKEYWGRALFGPKLDKNEYWEVPEKYDKCYQFWNWWKSSWPSL